jgi:hypothetical protein
MQVLDSNDENAFAAIEAARIAYTDAGGVKPARLRVVSPAGATTYVQLQPVVDEAKSANISSSALPQASSIASPPAANGSRRGQSTRLTPHQQQQLQQQQLQQHQQQRAQEAMTQASIQAAMVLEQVLFSLSSQKHSLCVWLWSHAVWLLRR